MKKLFFVLVLMTSFAHANEAIKFEVLCGYGKSYHTRTTDDDNQSAFFSATESAREVLNTKLDAIKHALLSVSKPDIEKSEVRKDFGAHVSEVSICVTVSMKARE